MCSSPSTCGPSGFGPRLPKFTKLARPGLAPGAPRRRHGGRHVLRPSDPDGMVRRDPVHARWSGRRWPRRHRSRQRGRSRGRRPGSARGTDGRTGHRSERAVPDDDARPTTDGSGTSAPTTRSGCGGPASYRSPIPSSLDPKPSGSSPRGQRPSCSRRSRRLRV